MSDASLPDDPTSAPDSGDVPGALDGLLADALARGEDGAAAGPAPDPARVAAHFAGVGDAALLDEASERPEIRRLLAEVASVEAEMLDGIAPLSPSVRERAVAAFGEGRVPATRTSDVNLAEREATPRVRILSRWPLSARAAAAVLVAAVSLALLAFPGRPVEAAPALSIEGIERLDLSRGVASEGVRSLPVGRHIAPAPKEIVSIRLEGGSRVVLGAGDDLRVACDGEGCRRAAFALDRGDVVLSATASDPVVLLLVDGGRLDLLVGDARVAEGTPHASVALRAGARAVWTPSGGRARANLSGPTSVVLDGSAPSALGAASDALFRDLEFFGGRPTPTPTERVVSAPQWRILKRPDSPTASARVSEAGGLPAIRFDLVPGRAAAVAWRPDAEAAGAARSGRVDVLLRWKATAPSSASPRLTASLEGVAGATATAAVPSGPEKPVRLSLALPNGFDVGGETVLVLSCEGAPVVAWFEGAALRSVEAADRDPDPSGE